ncbi:zinc-binding protein A33-like [Echeneis naucrates]|uniref:zinc-binding protein A33-like n=1 Tax=Echeneis naucrates TaxID=173247 RepID=UPI0011143838|nr:zinc-binding protein A33-like [Echeneis naucrates]
MASISEEDFSCPICFEVFRDPVLLSCTHSFCKDCLKSWWREKAHNCPVCKRRSSKDEPPSNRALKNLCDAFLQKTDRTPSESVCSLHAEKLQLFCLDHQQPVCLICRDSEKHSHHRFRPINEAAQLQRKEHQESLCSLQKKLEDFEEVNATYILAAEHIQDQAQNTEQQIKEQFKKLHQFLQEEEEARIKALREEEEQKSKVMKEKIDGLSREIEALSNTIRDTEKELRAEDVSFLKNYKSAAERVQQRLLVEDPHLDSGALIDQAKHLGNLSYYIWNKMKDLVSYSPVILDPNTAHPDLILSEDLTSMRRAEFFLRQSEYRKTIPENPERFDTYQMVLGSEGFISGTHSWDVEVGVDANWELGVTVDSIHRKGDICHKFWGIRYYEVKDLRLKKKLERIRVTLDLNRRQASFSDVDTNRQIQAFRITVTETLFPYLELQDSQQMRILPGKIAVTE